LVRISVCAFTQAGRPIANETEEKGAERVGKNDIVLVQALVSIEKMGPSFRQEKCFFS
jgi:hypothetical protein